MVSENRLNHLFWTGDIRYKSLAICNSLALQWFNFPFFGTFDYVKLYSINK